MQMPIMWLKHLLVLVACLAMPARVLVAFGVTSSGGYYTVDTGAGLVFKVKQSNGDVTSIRYNGVEYQNTMKGWPPASHREFLGISYPRRFVSAEFTQPDRGYLSRQQRALYLQHSSQRLCRRMERTSAYCGERVERNGVFKSWLRLRCN